MSHTKFSHRLLSLAALLALALSAPLAARADGIHLPPHERVVLKNGLTVLLLEKHGVPMVSLIAIVKAGAVADPPGKQGLASVTANLLRKGTKSRSAQQFAADLDFIGGSFEADAGEDFTTITAEFLTKDLARGLDLFTDAVLHPAFPADETDKLLRQRLDGIVASKDEAREVIGNYFNGYLYGSHPYARPAGGDELSVKRIGHEDIQRFYTADYTPGNTILAVAGDFAAADMRKKLEDAFAAWSAAPGAPVKLAAAAPFTGRRLLLVDKPDLTQTFFMIGNIGTASGDPDRVAIRVVNTIFGGRFTSILNEELRVKSGLTYGVNSRFDNHKTPGPFFIFSYTQNSTTVQAIDMALKVLEDLHKNGVTKEQLDSAKSYIKGQFPPTIETSMQLAGRIATSEFFGLDDSEVNQLEARLDAVTPEVARQVIHKHFPLENLVFVLVGKASEIKPAVAKYASKMDTRAISEPGFWPPPAAAPPK